MRDFFRTISAIVYKDFLLEIRTKETISSLFVFSILVMVIFNFTFEQDRTLMKRIAPGVFWVAILFAGVLGLNHSFAREKEFNGLEGMLLSPVDRGVIYLGKVISNSLFLIITELIMFPIFEVFYNVHVFARFHWLLLVTILTTIGFVGVGTIFSVVALNTKMREIMLPLLLLPVSVPIIIAAVESTSGILTGVPISEIIDWIKLLSVFCLIFLIVSFLLFEYVLIE